jgi:hypothetical protein
MSYLSKHPEFKEAYCRRCDTLKQSEDMHSKYRCKECRTTAKTANLMAFLATRAQAPAPQPNVTTPKRRNRPNRIWQLSELAAVCEDYIGNGICMPELAKKHQTNQSQISKIISRYFGFNEQPVLFQIRVQDDDITTEP